MKTNEENIRKLSEAKSRPVASGTEDRRPESEAGIALKSLSRIIGRQYNSAQGNALGKRTHTPGQPFSAPAPATEQLINVPKFRDRLTIFDCRTVVTTPVLNSLFLIFYFLFQNNKEHRIRPARMTWSDGNNDSESLSTPRRGEMLIAPGKEGRRNPGMDASHTPGQPFSAPALAPEQLINVPKFRGRLTIFDFRTVVTTPVLNSLFIIFYFLFQNNKEHRIRPARMTWSDGNNDSESLSTPRRGEMLITPGKEGRRNPGMDAPHKSCQLFSAQTLNDLPPALPSNRDRLSQGGGESTPLRGEMLITPSRNIGINPGMSACHIPGQPFSAPATATEQLINVPKFRERLTNVDAKMGVAVSKPRLKFCGLEIAAPLRKKTVFQNNKTFRFFPPLRGESPDRSVREGGSIPTSFTYRPSGQRRRTRSSQGAGRIRACLPPFYTCPDKKCVTNIFSSWVN